MTKRIAISPWAKVSKNWQLGTGFAYVSRVGRSHFTAVLNAKYKNFQLDISRGQDSAVIVEKVSVFGVSLAYVKVLEKNK